MKRKLFCGCLVLLLFLGAATVAAIILIPIRLPFNLSFLSGRNVAELPPTLTPVPGVPTPLVTPPPITVSDHCEGVASASGLTIDAQQQRTQVPTNTLPNGRPFPGAQPRNPNAGGPIPNQVLIVFTSDSSQQDRNAYIRSIQGRSRRNIDKLNTYVVTVPPSADTSNLPTSPIVVRIEPDYQAGATQDQPPNDPRYGDQWGLPIIGAPVAWPLLGASPQTVTVAVIDSGICPTHPDLAGRIVAGYDFVDNDNDPTDVFGHGCGVSGIIAANTNNGLGMAGVAPNAQIMPLRVLDAQGVGGYSNISAAIVYATDNGAQIINMSLAGTQYSQVMADAVNYALANGVTVIAAAGNAGTTAPYYPAAFSGVIAVGSVDPDLTRSSFSNYGAYVRIYAPGRDILATTLDGDYQTMSGTSFSAPEVAGIAVMNRVFGIPLNIENNVVFVYPPGSTPKCG